jgi:hypothetical protein
MVTGVGVEQPNELARMNVNQVLAAFESVDFLDHRNGDNYIIFLKMENAGSIVKENISIQDEYFLHKIATPMVMIIEVCQKNISLLRNNCKRIRATSTAAAGYLLAFLLFLC